jgi:hypothetical protein
MKPAQLLGELALWISDNNISNLSLASKQTLYSISTLYNSKLYWKRRMDKYYGIFVDSNFKGINNELLYRLLVNIKCNGNIRIPVSFNAAITSLNKIVSKYSFIDVTVLLDYIKANIGSLFIFQDDSIFKNINLLWPRQIHDIVRNLYENLKYSEIPPNLSYPVTRSYTAGFIDHYRRLIHDEIVTKYLKGQANFNSLSSNILEHLYELYDQYFFKMRISQILKTKNAYLTLHVNSKLTRAAGRCGPKGCNYIIDISDTIILQTFRGESKYHIGSGLKCYDRTECLMHTFEHELMHLVMLILPHRIIKGNPIYKGHGYFFKELVAAYFGHTETTHQLFVQQELVHSKEDFKVGQVIKYKNVKNTKSWIGTIIKLNAKRAVVCDQKGASYRIDYSSLYPYKDVLPKQSVMQPPTIQTAKLIVPMDSFKEGKNVKVVQHNGGSWIGTILKTNPKTATVKNKNDNKVYRVPYPIMKPV